MIDTITAAWVDGETVTLAGVAQGQIVHLDLPRRGAINLIVDLAIAIRQMEAAHASHSRSAAAPAAADPLTTDDPYPARIGTYGE